MSTVANGNRGEEEDEDGDKDKRSEFDSINIIIFNSALVDFEGEDNIGRCLAEVGARGSTASRDVTTAICC